MAVFTPYNHAYIQHECFVFVFVFFFGFFFSVEICICVCDNVTKRVENQSFQFIYNRTCL